jgi:hypothetical protein
VGVERRRVQVIDAVVGRVGCVVYEDRGRAELMRRLVE